MTSEEKERELDLATICFTFVWVRLEEEGICDSVGSVEYRRVLREWLAQGTTTDIEPFIRVRSNWTPSVDPPEQPPAEGGAR